MIMVELVPIRHLMPHAAANFIGMEKIIQFLDQNQSVQDSPRADRLIVTYGEVVFENFNFQYDTPEGPPQHLVHGAQV
ncbi:hypothetical protein BGZ81_004250 [Podila clonocystis]|nr:hypothetical protein BGZ81_004250 [Podila clonocystis]